MTDKQERPIEVLQLTADIVASHLSNNTVPLGDVPQLIKQVYDSLSGLGSDAQQAPNERPHPAVSIRKSITPEFIVCLEDGKKLKMLKRHLKTAYNMTPEQYRKRWGLPADYPMVAPNYAKQRSEFAKRIGLGRKTQGRRKKAS